MSHVDVFNRFEVHNDLALHDKIGAKSLVESLAIILNGDGDLPFDPESPQMEEFFVFASFAPLRETLGLTGEHADNYPYRNASIGSSREAFIAG